jgi:hypothetical protein
MRSLLSFVVVVAACGTSPAPTTGADPVDAAGSGGMPAVPGGGTAGDGAVSPGTTGGADGSTGLPAGSRDWNAFPAIVDIAATPTIYALSDVHGGYDRLAALLTANGITSRAPSSSTDAHWGAGTATLVVTGDMIDKGPSSVEVLDFLMALQADATKAGGRVIVTLGNHEAEFLVDPMNSKATGPAGIDTELATKGVMPAAIASGADPRGAWLRRLPFGARVGGWFFSHAGDTQGRTVAALSTALEAAVKAHSDYNDPDIVGTTSILESRSWYSNAGTGAQNATALGVKHIAFGHDPSALGPKGKIAFAPDHVLLRIDCGMSPGVDDSTGMILRVTELGANDVVEQLDATGKASSLFSAPR